MSNAAIATPVEVRELDPHSLKPPMNITLVTDQDGLDKVADFIARTDDFAYDLETNVVERFVERKIRVIQIGNRNEQYVIDLLAFAGSTEALMGQGWKRTPAWAVPVVEALREGLESGRCLKLGVNLNFEFMASWWCLGLRPWNFYDCQIVEKILLAGKVNFYEKDHFAMDDLVRKYCARKIDKALQTSFDLETPLTDEQIMYAALDTRLPYSIKGGQAADLKRLGLERTADIENHAIPAFAEMQINGFYLNPAKWLANLERVKERHCEHIKALDTFFLKVRPHKSVPPVEPEVLAQLEKTWRDTKVLVVGVCRVCHEQIGEVMPECPLCLANWRTIAKDRAARKEAQQRFYAARKLHNDWKKALSEYEGEAAINYGSPDQVLQALWDLGIEKRVLKSTNDRVLGKLVYKYPVLKALQNFRETEKIIDSYGENFLTFIDPDTGRIHARFSQMGTATGRTSAVKPPTQTIPKEEEYRECWEAPEGYVTITIDMAGAELRILAEMSGEKVWIDAFKKNWDVHSVSAEIVYGNVWKDAAEPGCAYYHKDHQKCECKEHKKLRNYTKTVSFGICYGLEAKALAAKLNITEKEAIEILKKWRDAFPVVVAFLKKLGDDAKMKLEARSFAGRVRWFLKPDWAKARKSSEERAKKDGKNPALVGSKDVTRTYYSQYSSIEREGKNAPIQSGNADVAKTAMGSGSDKNGVPFMWHGLPKFGAELCSFVHDEFILFCPKETAEACRDFVGDCIQRAGAEFMKSVEMLWESHIEQCWTK